MAYLFFDIDNTVLSKDTSKIPDDALKAIRQAMALGHKCVWCTGRTYRMCDEVSYQGIKDAVICNGAGVVINDQMVYKALIDDDVVKKTLDAIEALGGGYQIQDGWYGVQNDYTHQHFAHVFRHNFPDQKIEDVFKIKAMKHVSEYAPGPIMKIDFSFDTYEQAKTFLDHLDQSLDYITNASYFVGEGSQYGEITIKGVSKGVGIRKYVELLGGSMEDTYGFGDSTNDIPMLEACHTAIVMGNGTDDAKAVADYLTGDINEGGLVQAMKHFKLI